MPEERLKSKRVECLTSIGSVVGSKGCRKPLAVLAGTDTRARHVLEACRLYNFEVPGEISVTGVGNDEIICNLADPTLTSIALRPEAIGRDAARAAR